jgi:hypothetical protein
MSENEDKISADKNASRIDTSMNIYGARGGVVAKAPRYKPAGRAFDSR